jgi:hypothetical protein
VRRLARPLLLLAALLGTTGCSIILADPDETAVHTSPSASSDDQERLRRAVTENPEDLRLRYALARQLEEKGLLEAASLNYGVVAHGLPVHRFTRPWLSYARVELALDRDRSATEALEEVLAVVPDDHAWYTLNPDYREAALLLAPLLVRDGRTEELHRLQARFTEQLGGDPEEWPLN